MGKINKKALLISLILAVICVFAVMTYISSMTTQPQQEDTVYISVLVAGINLYSGDIITAEDIQTVSVPAGVILPTGITDEEELIGKYVKLPIYKGETFTAERLATIEEMKFSFSIEEGMRAFSIPVDETKLISNLLEVGDYIDILGTLPMNEELDIYYDSSSTILQNIKVLSISTDYSEGELRTKTSDMPKTIVLELTPEQVELVNYLVKYGEYDISLRSKGDDSISDTNGVIIDDLIPERAKEKPEGTAVLAVPAITGE